jgi:hypothetical protein
VTVERFGSTFEFGDFIFLVLMTLMLFLTAVLPLARSWIG